MNLLCFGDSNTYGYMPGGIGRFDSETRYCGLLSHLLGDAWSISENDVVGRTACFTEKKRPGKNGLDDIHLAVKKANPDLILLMLGTNDVKSEFNANENILADNITYLAKKALESAKELGKSPRILLISPASISEDVFKYTDNYNAKSIRVSRKLSETYNKTAKDNNFLFLDANDYANVSPFDGEHLDKTGHHSLALAIYDLIKSTSF